MKYIFIFGGLIFILIGIIYSNIICQFAMVRGEVIITRISQNQLNELLEEHREWIRTDGKGIKPLLEKKDFSGLDFRGADLSHAKLSESNLSHCNLRRVNFMQAELQKADLSHTNIYDSNFFRANLNGAILNDVRYNEYSLFFLPMCPEEGSFIGYKRTRDGLVKLFIPEDARRCSATTCRCRANKVLVLDIIDYDGNHLDKAYSLKDKDFIYEMDKEIIIEDFDENRWNESGKGIHFFLTKDIARKY